VAGGTRHACGHALCMPGPQGCCSGPLDVGARATSAPRQRVTADLSRPHAARRADAPRRGAAQGAAAPRDQVMADLAHLYAVALRAYKPAEAAAAARAALPARGAAPAARGGAACGLQLAGLAAHVQVRQHERA